MTTVGSAYQALIPAVDPFITVAKAGELPRVKTRAKAALDGRLDRLSA